jgi:2-polyprenyl-6-methoxyphenol hydroxylase-like FAD-dependent oxidoreductase
MSGQRTQVTDVLIAGGGLTGLTAALVLRHHGVPVILAEKHATTSPQPKARRFHMRSMEIFRELGLAATVHTAASDLVGHDRMAAGRTLAEAEQLPSWQHVGPAASADPAAASADPAAASAVPAAASARPAAAPASAVPLAATPVEVSPERPCLIAQDLLEPVLRQAAEDAGAGVRFETELTGFTQHGDHVAARLLDRRTGAEYEVRARYLLAADGGRSPIREALEIGRSGRGAFGGLIASVYFTADLSDVVRGREFNLCQIEHPDALGTLTSVDGRRRWVFAAPAVVPGAIGPDRNWPAVLRTALGVPAPDLEVRNVLRWRTEMLVADRYSAGRVHLLGDAAHVMPPFAASGANTGIADAHNIGWKLAAVLRGEAVPELLDSYDAERRPAGWFAADQSARRTADLRTMAAGPDPSLAHPYVLALGGFQYTDGAIVRDQVSAADPEPVTEFAPAGRVGTRIPHRWLDSARTRSTIDAAGPGWAILMGPQAGPQASPQTRPQASPQTGPQAGPMPCDQARPRTDHLPTCRLEADFLAPGEFLLLRPDHVVAWRGKPGDPQVAERVRESVLSARE